MLGKQRFDVFSSNEQTGKENEDFPGRMMRDNMTHTFVREGEMS
jgi:hypothetical protein